MFLTNKIFHLAQLLRNYLRYDDHQSKNASWDNVLQKNRCAFVTLAKKEKH